MNQTNAYIRTKCIREGSNKKFVAVLTGGRLIVDSNNDPIIRSTRKEIQDYIRANWNEIRTYN